ncbi:ABC transporter ATP-binding protein [Nocardia pneumoniae]|uniref:ABC transporter ATP-binding protein n=1 Tax=Nocardia pneumoniae TaxID=228601 RepID=UPI00030EB189|nr:ABC transporter ATP-binding protein [Nocardia pneumoniae]
MDTTIHAGEMFTLLGPSGCGKSTLLRMIAGFVAPTSGRILFGDKDVTATPPNRRDTGMVFQNYALFPHMTVAENVAYGLRARKVDRKTRSERVRQALGQVGLAGYGDRRIDRLSGGQQQRVALARAVVIGPAVLLLDEPLSNLDAKLREETRTQIRRVQTEAGITAVYVTHDQAEAMAMSDRIVVLDAGRVHQIGTPHAVYHCPATAFVARFIGRSNVVPVTVVDVADQAVRVALGDGASLTAPTPDFEPVVGDELALSLRPEALGFTTPEDGLCKGRVSAIEFTGATSTYTVVSENLTLQVTVPDSAAGPRNGDNVSVGITSGRPWLIRP